MAKTTQDLTKLAEEELQRLHDEALNAMQAAERELARFSDEFNRRDLMRRAREIAGDLSDDALEKVAQIVQTSGIESSAKVGEPG